MKNFLLLLILSFLFLSCSTNPARFVRIQATEIDGNFSGGPINGFIKAKDFLMLIAPCAVKNGTDFEKVSENFYLMEGK